MVVVVVDDIQVLEAEREEKRRHRAGLERPVVEPPKMNRLAKEVVDKYKTFHHTGVWVSSRSSSRRKRRRRVNNQHIEVVVHLP